MRRYILDTNAVNALINHLHGVDLRAQRARRSGAKVGTCGPVVGEFFYGLELSSSRDDNMKRATVGVRKLTLWPFDLAAGVEFGRLRAELRRIGRAMQIVDMQLAATALTMGNCTVITTDTDLSAVPGLCVENWVTPAP